jgi:hypothetical protein
MIVMVSVRLIRSTCDGLSATMVSQNPTSNLEVFAETQKCIFLSMSQLTVNTSTQILWTNSYPELNQPSPQSLPILL